VSWDEDLICSLYIHYDADFILRIPFSEHMTEQNKDMHFRSAHLIMWSEIINLVQKLGELMAKDPSVLTLYGTLCGRCKFLVR
jgi:hypothetical protein